MAYTFDHLRVRVAEYLGLAAYSGAGALPPADTHDLDLVNRLVNDGYRRFLAARHWGFLRAPLQVRLTPGRTGTATVASPDALSLTDAKLVSAGLAAASFVGWTLRHTSADGAVRLTVVSAFTPATGTFTFTAPLSAIPAVGDAYSVAAPHMVAGQDWRAYLPADFQALTAGGRMAVQQDGAVTEVFPPSDPSAFDATHAVETGSGGRIVVAAIRALPPDLVTSWRRRELVVWPRPTTVAVLFSQYKRLAAPMLAATDLPVSGPEHDETLLRACLAAAELDRHDRTGEQEARYRVGLEQSILIDRDTHPDTRMDYGDTTGVGVRWPRLSVEWGTINGKPFPV